MMDRTDRHFRAMFRDISRHALLYTPMISARALVEGRADVSCELELGVDDGPVALQLGGSEPAVLGEATRIAAARGFVEVDLNCGCPSPAAARVLWGAALMDHPGRVADAVAAMVAAARIDVTVKHRLGIAGRDDADRLLEFVDAVVAAGAARVVVHARAAVLGGLGTAANRRVPPLRPEAVAALVAARPGLVVVDNGGIEDLDGARARWRGVGERGGVMVGRAAYDDPYRWIDVDRVAFGDATPRPDRVAVARAVFERAAVHVAEGGRAHAVTRHALGLWRGVPGARAARALVAELAHDVTLAEAAAAIDALALASAAEDHAQAQLLAGLKPQHAVRERRGD
jgi:tRNA-dihydrouridine synthase A